jgi:hypothetical protein
MLTKWQEVPLRDDSANGAADTGAKAGTVPFLA